MKTIHVLCVSILISIALVQFSTSMVNAQGVGINTTNSSADPSAMLDVSGVSKGVLINRMTSSERDAIALPAEGLMIFNTTTKCFNVYKNQGWYEWCGTCIPPSTPVAGNNGPICEGTALSLTANNISNATYSWTGPNSFTSTIQNPTVSANATMAMAGTYSVITTLPNGCSGSPGSTSVVVNSPPVAPTVGSNIASQSQIIWNWNTVSGVTGYKWNTVNNYATATDNSTSTSYTQTGLTCGTSYTLYVWSYNTCGNSTAAILNQAASACPCTDATGGIITHVSGKTIHTFTSSGTFTPPSCLTSVEVLVVGGGAGGGSRIAGGGGAGALIYDAAHTVTNQTYTVTVGNGGAGGVAGVGAQGSNGTSSVFDNITADGGGGGGYWNGGSGAAGSNGGSGGGGGAKISGTISGGSGTTGGNAGGTGFGDGSLFYGGGGGGAGAVGGTHSGNTAGVGGAGIVNSISGSAVTYAGGGGGGAGYSGQTTFPGAGGAGGGGAGGPVGSFSSTIGVNGTTNTGGGGGGSGDTGNSAEKGGDGGSGIVIISYPTAPPCLPAPTTATNTASVNQIVWNWNTVIGATGYKWNTANNYTTATDNGISITHTQTGLNCNTSNTLYVWAYNNCGASLSTALTQTTSACPCSDGTGGTITHVSGKTIHTFTSSGTFTPPVCVTGVEVLVVGGGGGGGSRIAGGGGAGALIYDTVHPVTNQTYTVTVGNGGAGGVAGVGAQGTNGANSVFDNITATGGGGGGYWGGGGGVAGSNGGSGGGGGAKISGTVSGGTGTTGGNAGGIGFGDGSNFLGGGGGGAGAVGGIHSGNTAGAGGAGIVNSITGSPVTYAGGGGAGGTLNPGAGGAGGGGAGGIASGNQASTAGVNGTANTGGGGGGSGDTGNSAGKGGDGGSGIVIINYPTP